MTTPRVSILMGVFNGERYLRAALDGIFAQTLRDFELIVVDDGSTDGTAAILDGVKDSRLRVLRQQNRGLAAALNAAAATAGAELLARHDADDVSLPGRLEHQVRHMETHPGYAVLGTWATRIDPAGRPCGTMQVPTSLAWMRLTMTYRDPLLHPTVVMRRQALNAVGGYDESIRYSQDSELWRRLLLRFQAANLPEYLYQYRVHPAAVGISKSREQQRSHRRILRRYRRDFASYYAGAERPSPMEHLTRALVAAQVATEWVGRFRDWLG